MRAVLCKEHGSPESLVVEDVPSPSPGPNGVVVEVRACGVNFPDTLIIQGKYQFQPDLPFSPGGEVAGVVKEAGEMVHGFKPGDPVIAFTGWGGFAEEVLTDPSHLMPMPDGMDFATAASFVMTYGTSMHALADRADLQPGETLLVLGAAGGVGLAAVEIGKAMGARVIAAASDDGKLEFCRAHGADATVNYETEDLKQRVKDMTAGDGADVVYDPVGGPYSEPALRATAWAGRYLVVGFASGEIPRIPLNLTLLKGCSVVGVFYGAFAARDPARNGANLKRLVGWFSDATLKPHIDATYPLERAAEALNEVLARRVRGKVVLVTDPR